MDVAFYIASALGAVAVWLMAPKPGRPTAAFGALLGAATLGGLWLYLARFLPGGGPDTALGYQYVFGAIALASAVRVITHRQPVYAALWFVMLVLATAGLLLLLAAEFVAFAMIIIYAGAILVTYLFVMMLASQESEPGEPAPAYDREAREPALALVAGFLLLAVLLGVLFGPHHEANPNAAATPDPQVIAETLPHRPAARIAARLGDAPRPAELTEAAARLDNSERVGLDLFEHHPLGLELAGLILLVSLIGAVVFAREQIQAAAPNRPAPKEEA